MSNDQYWLNEHIGGDDDMTFLNFPDSANGFSTAAPPPQHQQSQQPPTDPSMDFFNSGADDIQPQPQAPQQQLQSATPTSVQHQQPPPQSNSFDSFSPQVFENSTTNNNAAAQGGPNPSAIMEQMKRQQQQQQQQQPQQQQQQQLQQLQEQPQQLQQSQGQQNTNPQQQAFQQMQQQLFQQLQQQQQQQPPQQPPQEQGQQNPNPQQQAFQQMQQQLFQQLQQTQPPVPPPAPNRSTSQGSNPSQVPTPAAQSASPHGSNNSLPPQFQPQPQQPQQSQGQPSNQGNHTQQQQRQFQQQFQQQFGPQNVEKFLRLLEDFMNRNGTPLTDRYPIIGGKRMNLFLIYFMMSKLGGFNNVLKSGKILAVASKLGIPPDNNELLKEFVGMYRKNLFPFEQYSNTPDGMKELNIRRHQLETQMRQQQQQQQQSGQMQGTQVQSPSQVDFSTKSSTSTAPTPTNLNQVPLSFGGQDQQITTPAQRNSSATSASSTSKIQTQKSQKIPLKPQPQVQQQPQQQQPLQPQQQKPAALVPETLTGMPTPDKVVEAEPNKPFVPDFIRNYVPQQRVTDRASGVDVDTLNSYGEQLDHLKPVFLFVPELGKIDINALTMSLASDIDAEINVALNVLLIVTTDPISVIPFESCMNLLDVFCNLITSINKELLTGDLNGRKRKEVTDDVSPIFIKKSKIDRVFEKYQANGSELKDEVITVDSFTAKEIDDLVEDDDRIEVDGSEISNESEDETDSPMVSESGDKVVKSFGIPAYVDLLHSCKLQTEGVSANVHGNTYQNRRLMLVEELNTITMIIRNLSFTNDGVSSFNNSVLAHHQKFLDSMFSLLYSIATDPEAFVFSRKILCLLKDILMILINIAQEVELRNSKEALLILVLCLSFGAKLEEEESNSGLYVPRYDPSLNKYQFHAIDVVSKIMCGSRTNKQFMGTVLAGEEKNEQIINLIRLFTGSDNIKDGKLIMLLFGSLMSVIPLDQLHLGVDPFHDRLPIVLESLLGCLIISDYIEEFQLDTNLALNILVSPELIGCGLLKLSFMFAAIYAKTHYDNKEMYGHISGKCLELVNGLLASAIEYATSSETSKTELNKLNLTPKIFPADESILGALMTPNLTQEVFVQAVEATKLMVKLQSLVK